MSHEIRTPMNGVIGMTELLLDTDLSDEQLSFATTVRSSAEALLTIIEDILDFSKIEAGKLELDPREFELRDTVDDVCDLLAAGAHDRGLEVTALVDSDVRQLVIADQGRLRQILTNLIGNAVKFTSEGEVVVTVSAGESPDAEGAVLTFEVCDTGIGMEPDTLERIFESFSQADASTTRRFGGTGLGLAIARQLADLMGGRMWAESRFGAGSTFSFTISTGTRAPASSPPMPSSLEQRRVLVVDDHEVNRIVLTQHLVALGSDPEAACGASEGLALMRAAADSGAPFELVLLDFNIPAMDGVQMGAMIKADPALASAKLLLLTSSGEELRSSKAAGFAGYATKPIRRSRLSELIERALAGPAVPIAASSVIASPRAGRVAHDGRCVLVAEDNLVNQRVAVGLLDRRGFQVAVAANGREAVEMHERAAYSAVFMDCQMPELDGYEATGEIRRREGADRHVPIIAMTANTMTGDRERCLDAGMDDYVGKPIRPDTLDSVIARWLPGADAAVADVPSPSRTRDGAHGDEPPVDATPIFEASLLDDACGQDAETRGQLVEMFREQARTQVEQVVRALADGDAHDVERVAHDLKGSSAAMGALRLAEVSHRLCEAARDDELDGAAELGSELEHSFKCTCAVFLQQAL